MRADSLTSVFIAKLLILDKYKIALQIYWHLVQISYQMGQLLLLKTFLKCIKILIPCVSFSETEA